MEQRVALRSIGSSSKFELFTVPPGGAVLALEGDTDFDPVDDEVVLEVGGDFVDGPLGVLAFELARESVVDEEERFDVERIPRSPILSIVP